MKRILVIEDDAAHRRMLKTGLEEVGYEVVEAQNGKVGLRLYHQQPCDVVITDIFMPEKEGLETILELKRQFPAVKIIAISGGGFRGSYAGRPGADNVLEAAKEFGADHILYKPVKIERLLVMVEELLNT